MLLCIADVLPGFRFYSLSLKCMAFLSSSALVVCLKCACCPALKRKPRGEDVCGNVNKPFDDPAWVEPMQKNKTLLAHCDQNVIL